MNSFEDLLSVIQNDMESKSIYEKCKYEIERLNVYLKMKK